MSAAPFLVAAPRVVPATPGAGVLAPGYVALEGARIAEVAASPPPRAPDLALQDGVLAPGFVDLQVNGCSGTDFAALEEAGWERAAAYLAATGTTAFLPTFVSAPVPDLVAAIRSARELARRAVDGARILGLHLEGPFLSPARAGAHQREALAAPTREAVARLIEAGAGLVRIVTLAPEIEGGLAAAARFASAGMVVSLGHTDATAAQAAAAADAGARMVTHLFNAQRPFHHREPGVAGQALTDARLTCGLIADPPHVAPQTVALAFAAAPGRICLVTDAVAAAGAPPGQYSLGGSPIRLPEGEGAAPVRPDGTVAGSVLRMDQAVANAVAAGVDLAGAVAAASRVPADLIGRADLGRLARGAAADLVWLGDDLRAKAVWIAGRQLRP